jgi:hypothetical protein
LYASPEKEEIKVSVDFEASLHHAIEIGIEIKMLRKHDELRVI